MPPREARNTAPGLSDHIDAIRAACQALDPARIRAAVLASVRDALSFDRVIFFSIPEGQNAALAEELVETGPPSLHREQLRFAVPSADPLLRRGAEETRPFLAGRPSGKGLEAGMLSRLAARAMAVAPLRSAGRLSALIVADNAASGRALTAASLDTLSVLAAEAEMALEVARLSRRTEEIATRDDLTTVYNRRQILQRLTEEMARAKRYRRPLSVALGDLDRFQALNEALGHGLGDQILQEVGKLIRATSRDVDIVGRIGGEEFLTILPETNGDASRIYGDRVRHAVELLDAKWRPRLKGQRLSLTLGTAGFDSEADTTRDALLAKARKALAAAKSAAGRPARS